MRISNECLRTLCIENGWFTCGSIRQYEKLFDANRNDADIHELTIIIWLCSDNSFTRDDIRDVLERSCTS